MSPKTWASRARLRREVGLSILLTEQLLSADGARLTITITTITEIKSSFNQKGNKEGNGNTSKNKLRVTFTK